jgi:hypothetical protein
MSKEKNSKRPGRKQIGLYKSERNATIINNYPLFQGMYAVYGLSTEYDADSIHYVGSTRTDLNRRYANHISEADENGSAKEKWVWDLKKQGQKMVLILFEDNIMTQDDAFIKEQYYMDGFLEEGHPITNQIRAGRGTPGRLVSKETREKQSEKMKGKKCRLGKHRTQESILQGLETKKRNRMITIPPLAA